MELIDITTVLDSEQHVIVLDDGAEVFRGASSEARSRFPDAFSRSGGTSPAAFRPFEQSPPVE